MKKAVWIAFLPLMLNVIRCLANNSSEDCCKISDIPEFACDCTSCSLEKLPENIPRNLKVLILKDNYFNKSDGSPFKHFTSLERLDLSLNRLTNISQEFFVGLSTLKELDLYQDDLILDLPEGIFSPLVQLQSLRLSRAFNRGQPFPGNWIHSLSTELKLFELPVPAKYIFTKEFSRLKNLESLIITGNGCRLNNMTRDTFQVFSNTSLKTLEVKMCYLTDVASDALSMFHNLETLNLACNYHKNLDFKRIFMAAKNLPSPSLQTMVVDGSGRRAQNSLSPDLFDSPNFSNLQRLSLRSSQIIKIDVNFLKHIPRLQHINLGFNTVVQVSPSSINEALNMSVHILNRMNITTVDVSYFGTITGEAYTFRNRFCWPDPVRTEKFFKKPPSFITTPSHLKTGNRTIDYTYFNEDDNEKFLRTNVPWSLRHVYASHIGITRDTFDGFTFNDNNILHIDFSKNQIRTFSGPLIGFENLQGLDMNSCGLVEIKPEAIEHLPSLNTLQLSKNSLISENLRFLRHLSYSTKLKFLDLSFNLLTTIMNADFCHLKSLEVLNLTNNRISKITTDFAGNHNLKTLDLSDCSLTSLPEALTRGLDTLHRQSSGAFQVHLKGNPWSCNCEDLKSLRWMKSTEVITVDEALTCLYDNKTVEIASVDLDKLDSECHPKTLSLATVVAVPSLLIFASLLATSLSFHYRWTLKWKFYLIRRKARMMFINSSSKDELLLPNSPSKTYYDAFVSYNHSEDYTWVQDTFLSKLEDSWNMKLCLGQRDFMVGVPIAENICEAIDNSRFTIVVITPAFLTSGWCDFELHMALTRGRQHLIILYKEEVDISQTSKTLRTLMRSTNYIEYSENPDGQQMFWQRLYDTLTRKTENEVI